MKEEELEEILEKHEWLPKAGWTREDFIKALKECYNKGVTDSAESAESYILKYPLHNPKSAVDKQSILKNLIP